MIRIVKDHQQSNMNIKQRLKDDHSYEYFKENLKSESMDVVVSNYKFTEDSEETLISLNESLSIKKCKFHLIDTYEKQLMNHTFTGPWYKTYQFSQTAWPHLVWVHLLNREQRKKINSSSSWWVNGETADYMMRQDYQPKLMIAFEEHHQWLSELSCREERTNQGVLREWIQFDLKRENDTLFN